jgi:hypothetical protein
MSEESRTGLRVVIKAKGAKDFFFEIVNPLTVPRVGELVRFDDQPGLVEMVVWDIRAEPMPTVEVTCVPAPRGMRY